MAAQQSTVSRGIVCLDESDPSKAGNLPWTSGGLKSGGRAMQMSIPSYKGLLPTTLAPLAAEGKNRMDVPRCCLPLLVLSALRAVGAIEGECASVIKSKCH